jgi:hypothetical protein
MQLCLSFSCPLDAREKIAKDLCQQWGGSFLDRLNKLNNNYNDDNQSFLLMNNNEPLGHIKIKKAS